MKIVYDEKEGVLLTETGEQIGSLMPRYRHIGPMIAAAEARVAELEAALRGMIDDWGICHLESTDALARAFEVLGLQGGTGPRGAA